MRDYSRTSIDIYCPVFPGLNRIKSLQFILLLSVKKTTKKKDRKKGVKIKIKIKYIIKRN
jgi:hypothetical protein